jgi:SNF2 family DNA or RNA helicase
MNYTYKTEPYAHQRAVFEKTRDMEAYALLMEQGTGKTKVIVDTVAHLYGQRKLEAVLVIAPNGVHRNWGLNEIPIHMPDRVPRYVATWDSSRSSTKKYKREMDGLFNGAEELKVLLMNVEAFSHKGGVEFAKNFLGAFGRVMVVIDESSKIKNVKAQRTKNIVRLRESATYRRILTGTPVTQNHLDVFPQFYFLDPKILGQQSFHVFKHYYSIVVKKKAWKIAKSGKNKGKRVQYTFEDVMRSRNMDELQERIAPWSYRVTKEECLDLPPKVYTEIPIPMAPEQRRIYAKLKTELLMEAGDEEIPVLMQLTRLLRLHQIAGGFVATEDGTTEPIPGTNPKLAALMDDVDTLPAGEQCIIWARFRAEIEAIFAALEAEYGPGCAGTYYGGTKPKERAKLIQDFQGGKVRFFIGSQQAAGMGLTLTAASTVYYYSNSFSLEDRLQSEDRCHRIGQHKPVLYKDIVAMGTIDRLVIGALKSKKGLADILTGDAKRAGGAARLSLKEVLDCAEWADSIRERTRELA